VETSLLPKRRRAMALSHLSQLLPQVSSERPRTLETLADEFRAHEALEEPDLVVPLNELRMTPRGHIEAPGTRPLALTDPLEPESTSGKH
jgi:hypothetical protein